MVFYILFILASVVNQLIYVFSNKFYKRAFYESFRIKTSHDTSASAASTVETQKLNLVPVAAAARFKVRAKKFSIVQNK